MSRFRACAIWKIRVEYEKSPEEDEAWLPLVSEIGGGSSGSWEDSECRASEDAGEPGDEG